MTTVTAELSDRISELLTDELIILAESESGESVPHATRPLSDAERASGVKFGDIEQAQTEYLAVVAPALLALMGATRAAMVAEASRVTMSAVMLNQLDRWRTTPPARVVEATEKAAGVVREALMESFEQSGRLMVREAARQGVRLTPATLPPVTTPAPVVAQPAATGTRQAIDTMTRTVTNAAVDKVLDTTRQVYASPTSILQPPPPSVVDEILLDISDKGPLDVARQANNAVMNEGRFATIEDGPEPAWLYASELLDGRVCGPCSAIDGTEWDTLAEAREWYVPTMKDCAGGSRCRGTLVAVYEDADADAEWDD